MGKWSERFKPCSEHINLHFTSWNELNHWFDKCAVGRGLACPFIEELYVIGCYELYRAEPLAEHVIDVYSDSLSGYDFEVVSVVDTMDDDFDLCSLPLFIIKTEEGESCAYPEEIFA